MDERKQRLLRRMVAVLGIAVGAGLIYDGGIFYSRWSAGQSAKRQQAEAEAKRVQRTFDSVGGNELRIVAFYAMRGELCYGVTGAKTVNIEPPVGEVWPALSRCMQISPRKDTEYKIVAQDAAGHSAAETLMVKAR